jgi:hypothetical protein
MENIPMPPYKKTDLRQNKIDRVKPAPTPQPSQDVSDELDDILFAPLDKAPVPEEDNKKRT